MSVRIHQIAKEIDMENKALLKLLQERGFSVKSVSSTIDNISAESIREEFSGKKDSTPEPAETSEEGGETAGTPEPGGETAEPTLPERPAFKRPKGPIVRTAEDVER